MDKKTAKELLIKYLANNSLTFPENDVVVLIDDFNVWTFKGLLKIAFDL